MLYTATISSTPLRVRESRIVARLLLEGLDEGEWQEAIVDRNALQVSSDIGVVRSARILRARLEPLGERVWSMVHEGDRELATQSCFAGAIHHSRLLGDFLDLEVREELSKFERVLDPLAWTRYLADCRGRDPEMPHWSDTTVNKLRSIVFSMMAEVGYLESTQTLAFQNVFVRDELLDQLRERGETYVIRCLQVTT
jgi:hypothetical protein